MRYIKTVDNIKRPLLKGEVFLVPCIVKKHNDNSIGFKLNKIYVTPVINLPHSDKENGQNEIHYHADFRFIKHDNNGDFPTPQNTHSKYIFCENIRPKDKIDGVIQYFALPVINEDFKAITGVENIAKSKLKHKCIHKGKCPHRGYDLSQVNPIDGVITCPLHGLKFSAKTSMVLNEPIT